MTERPVTSQVPRREAGGPRPAAAGHTAPMRRASWFWVAAAVVGVLGGVANYLLATQQAAAGEAVEIGAAALVGALLGLGCWVVLAVVWLALQFPLRGGHGWARVSLALTAVLGVGLDVISLVGSWPTIAAAVVQLILLGAALVLTFRPSRG
jgi:hypothetical protein